MANIRKKVTVSVQTELSNFRIDNETQVWLPKDNDTNTGINASTNTVLDKTYIVGLRDKRIQWATSTFGGLTLVYIYF